ncbi:MAG: hypothetical protein ACR2KT_15345 [Methylocella sp.]
MGEKVDSSQPAKNPLAEAIREKAKSRFAKGLHSIDNCPAAPKGLAGIADELTAAILVQKLPEP